MPNRSGGLANRYVPYHSSAFASTLFSISPQLWTPHILRIGLRGTISASPRPLGDVAPGRRWTFPLSSCGPRLPSQPIAFQVFPQFGKAAIIMMPDVSVRFVQAHRNLFERVPLKETQAQRLPLLKRQIFESPLEPRSPEAGFEAFVVERHGERALSSRGALGHFSPAAKIPARQIPPPGKRVLVAHLDKQRPHTSLRSVEHRSPATDQQE